MNEASYINEAKNYLLGKPGVTEKILNLHLNYWREKKPKDMSKLFHAFLNHAKNRQGMPNSIGNISSLSEALYNFAKKLGITNSLSDYHIFKDVISYCQRINEKPYEVDKIFWLIGSGNFYLSNLKVQTSRDDFVQRVFAKK